MSSDGTAERRFLLLKKRLDALHYCQPLTIESAAMVEKLLNDLVKTTEGFQQMKKSAEEGKLQSIKNEQLLVPLKKENQRLIMENNQLHMEIVQAREECESKEGKWRAQLRLLEGERSDWRFMLTQKAGIEKKLNEDLLTLKAKLEFYDKGKGKENSDGNRSNDYDKILKEEQRKWMERIQEAQQQTLDGREQVRLAETAKVLLEENVRHLQIQVENRDKEIQRIKSKIDQKISNDYQLQDQIQKAQRLQTQMDLLTQENNRLNDELVELRKGQTQQKKGVNNRVTQREPEDVQRLQILETDLRESVQREVQLRNSLDDSKQQLIQLQQQLQGVIGEKEELQVRVVKSDQVIQAYQSDKSAFNRVVDSMKNERDHSGMELQNYKDQVQQLNIKLQQSEERLNFIGLQVEQVQRERDIIAQQVKRAQDECERERDTVIKLREQLRGAERGNDEKTVHIRELNCEIERLEQVKCNLEGQMERLRQDQFALSSDADMTKITRAKLEQMCDVLRRENELFLQGQQQQERILQQSRLDVQNLEREVSELRYEKRAVQDQLTQLSQRSARAEAQLELKAQECVRLNSQYNELQRELARLRFQGANDEGGIQEMKRELQDRLSRTEQRLSVQQQEMGQVKLVLVEREERIKQLEEILLLTRQENDRLLVEMGSMGELGVQNEQSLRLVREREQEFGVIQQELERLRDSERRLLVERERLSAEVKKNESLIINGNRQIEMIMRQKEDLMREVGQVRGELLKTRTDDNSNKNTSLKLSEKLSSQELALQDMRELLLREQQRSSKLQDQLNDAKKELQSTSARIIELDAQCNQMKTLSEGLERNREELIHRLQQKNGDRLNEERQLTGISEAKHALEEQLKALNQELMATRQSLELVDQERDEMQSALDEKSEICVRLEQRCRILEEEVERQQSRFVEVQSRGDKGFEAAGALEEKLKDLQFRLQKAIKESENLRYTLQAKDKELIELRADLQVIARENHSLNTQFARINQEKELALQQIMYIQQQDERTKEQLHLLRMEMQDLQSNYEEVCAENQRLQVSLQQAQLQSQGMMTKLTELEREGESQQQTFMQRQRRETEQGQRIAQLEMALNNAGLRVEEYERQIRELRNQNEQLLREYNQQRRGLQGFQYSQDDLGRQLASIDSERQLQQEQIKALRRELEAKDLFIDNERKRANDMESVLIHEREQQMRVNKQVEALRSQNEDLTIELEKQQLRLNSQNRQEFGGLSRVSGEVEFLDPSDQKRRKQDEIQDLLGELQQLRNENKKLKEQQFYQQTGQSGDKSLSEHSKFDSSAGWDRLRQESEQFKKTMNQAAISSQYLRMKMNSLNREYQNQLGPSIHKYS